VCAAFGKSVRADPGVLAENGAREARVTSSIGRGGIADDEGFLPSDHLGVAVELEL
jgi:hypothetical protein